MGIITTLKNGKDKVVKFYNDHKTGCKIAFGMVGTAIVGGTIYALCNRGESDDISVEPVAPMLPESSEEEDSKDDPLWNNNWKEEYRENWDKVNEFAKTLELVDGETYMIERQSEFDEYRQRNNLPVNIVSHLIDYEGSYPEDVVLEGPYCKLDIPEILD